MQKKRVAKTCDLHVSFIYITSFRSHYLMTNMSNADNKDA